MQPLGSRQQGRVVHLSQTTRGRDDIVVGSQGAYPSGSRLRSALSEEFADVKIQKSARPHDPDPPQKNG